MANYAVVIYNRIIKEWYRNNDAESRRIKFARITIKKSGTDNLNADSESSPVPLAMLQV